MHRSIAVAIGTLGTMAAVGVAGCGQDQVSKSDIEKEAKQQLSAQTQQGGFTFDTMSCPSDLDAKTGASETCTATTSNGQHYRVTASVTSVSNGKAELHFDGQRTG